MMVFLSSCIQNKLLKICFIINMYCKLQVSLETLNALVHAGTQETSYFNSLKNNLFFSCLVADIVVYSYVNNSLCNLWP